MNKGNHFIVICMFAGMLLGLAVGCVVGVSQGNIGISMCFGLVFGMIIGKQAAIRYVKENYSEIDNHPGAMPDVSQFETIGILSYDKKLQVYIGIAFLPGVVDRAQAETIAQSIELSSLK